MKQRAEIIQDEFWPLYIIVQTWKKITNWNEKQDKHSHKESYILKEKTTQEYLPWRIIIPLQFYSYHRKPETIYNGDPHPLKVSQPTFISLYRECIYTILDLRLILETKPKNCFQSQLDTNNLECGIIATIYKY